MNFSVLISVYIKENPIHLKQALESIWDNQILKPNEIIIVKDGALTFRLNEVLDDFAKKAPVKFLEFQNNLGLGEALNKGLKICEYEIIARMDTDDIALPDRFSKQIAYFKKNSKIDLVGSWIDEFMGEPANIVSTRKVPSNNSEIVKVLKSRCPFNHPTVMFRKKTVLNAGNYDSSYLKEDMSLWLRMYKIGANFANLEESLLLFRISPEMFGRRGGMNYVKSEIRMFNLRYNFEIINLSEYLFFLALTIPIRLAPTWIRKAIYRVLLR